MAVLDANDRAAVASRIMRQWNRAELGTIDITAPALLTMIGELDSWFDSNAAAANAAISQPTRGQTSTKFKALVFREVLTTRYLRS